MTGDIAIVGGGPAGAYLGFCLAQNDIYATIFDDSHPREKPCGGGITPFALDKFPLLRTIPDSYRYVDRVLFVSPEGREAMVSGQPLMNVSRERLDGYLLQRATDSGVKLIEERVVGVQEMKGRWLIKTANAEYQSKLLVGADGVNSVVRGTVLGPISREDIAACIGYYVKGVERDYSVLQFFKDFKGYAWIFPRETHSSIGVGLDINQAKQLPVYLNKFIEDYCPAIEKISPFGALVPAASSHKFYDLPCAGDNWILIGDAAGHVDPVLGEGIRYALWGAELTAGTILKGKPAMFDNQWRKAYGRDFVEACKLRDFIYDSKMLERGVALISQSGTFASIMMGVIAGTQSYCTLRKKVIASLPQILSEIK